MYILLNYYYIHLLKFQGHINKIPPIPSHNSYDFYYKHHVKIIVKTIESILNNW